MVLDLDLPHEGADDGAPGAPVGHVQPILEQFGKALELADDELQGP